MARGRKPKAKLSLQEQEDEVIIKWLAGERLTLEEAALAVWMMDGRKTPKPMTKMGYLKFEQRIMLKLRKECEKRHISVEELELFERHGVTTAKGTFDNNID